LNLKNQYSIIGGSAGAFVLVLIILFLPQTGVDPVPITPVGEQIIFNQTNDDVVDSTGEIDNSAVLGVLSAPPPPEQIVIEDNIDVISIPESTSSNLRSSRSGGGGGGSSSSDDSDFSYQLKLYEGVQESDGTIDSGQSISAVASTDDDGVDEVIFRWIDPTSNIVETEIVPLELESSEAAYPPDELGTWFVETDFGNGVVLREPLEVSFMVIPESPIGIIALVASSLATLLLFTRRGNIGGNTR
jgi:hypothetical protein